MAEILRLYGERPTPEELLEEALAIVVAERVTHAVVVLGLPDPTGSVNVSVMSATNSLMETAGLLTLGIDNLVESD